MSENNDPKAPSKKHMIVLWTAIATALGSQGIPKIIEMLDTKPTVEQVQEIVARQISALSKEQPVTVEAILELDERLDGLEKKLSDCRSIRPKPARTKSVKPAVKPKALAIIRASPVKRLKKVPEFNMQQQLLLPLQEESDK